MRLNPSPVPPLGRGEEDSHPASSPAAATHPSELLPPPPPPPHSSSSASDVSFHQLNCRTEGGSHHSAHPLILHAHMLHIVFTPLSYSCHVVFFHIDCGVVLPVSLEGLFFCPFVYIFYSMILLKLSHHHHTFGFDLCGTQSSSSMSCSSVLASFLPNGLKNKHRTFQSAVVLMYIRFRSSTQLTAGFGDQKIFRQMQKCNLFFLNC